MFAIKSSQIFVDGEAQDDGEKLQRQRKLAAEREAEKNEKEERKHNEKAMKQYQHRLNTAIYAETTQQVKEDKVLEHERDLHRKNITKNMLQNQVQMSVKTVIMVSFSNFH